MFVSLLRKLDLGPPLSVSNLNCVIVVSMFHSSLQKQASLATVYYPVAGGDSVCCGHGVIVFNSGTVQTSLEDSEGKKTQQTLKLNA